MNINCQYCQRKCRPIREKGTAYFQCDYHGAVRVRYELLSNNIEPNAYIAMLVVLYKEQTFHLQFFHNLPNTPFKFRIDQINRPPKTNHTILTLDFHPEITPENAAAKLPTYILFS